MTDTLAEGLHLIVPASGYPLGRHLRYEHMTEVVLRKELLLLFGQLFGENGLVQTVKHQTGNLFDTESSS